MYGWGVTAHGQIQRTQKEKENNIHQLSPILTTRIMHHREIDIKQPDKIRVSFDDTLDTLSGKRFFSETTLNVVQDLRRGDFLLSVLLVSYSSFMLMHIPQHVQDQSHDSEYSSTGGKPSRDGYRNVVRISSHNLFISHDRVSVCHHVRKRRNHSQAYVAS